MQTQTLTIGWTKSDMDNGYSSFMDGYRPGAEQHTETITVEVDREYSVEALAERALVATNAPYVEPGSVAEKIAKAIEATGYYGQGAHYSLSVGDTVTVGEVTVACERLGWKVVEKVGA